jgi:hypothetical protein
MHMDYHWGLRGVRMRLFMIMRQRVALSFCSSPAHMQQRRPMHERCFFAEHHPLSLKK